MIRTTRVLLAAATVMGVTGSGHAADMSQPRVVNYQSPVETIVPTGWYLRGDIGVGIYGSGVWREESINNPTSPTTAGWLNRQVGQSTNIDVGVGYQFTDNLRGDVTVGYRTGASIQGGDYITNTNNNPPTGQNVISGSVQSVTAMVNGYYDVLKWNGLSPYVGAGIGVAYNHLHQPTSIQTGGFNPTEYGVYGSGGTMNFAYALRAGLSYEVNSRLKLEAGYSYLGLGDARSGGLTCNGSTGPVNCTIAHLQIKQLYASDFHLGMRWLLDGGASTSYQTSFQPSYQQQTYQQQTYQQPAYQQQTFQQQTYQQAPSYQQQTYDQPVARRPSTSAPVIARY